MLPRPRRRARAAAPRSRAALPSRLLGLYSPEGPQASRQNADLGANDRRAWPVMQSRAAAARGLEGGDVDPLAEATRLRGGLADDPSVHAALLDGSSSSSSSSSTSGLDSSEESSEDSSDGELETPADRAGQSTRGVLSAHWTRVPLSRYVAPDKRILVVAHSFIHTK